MKNLIIPFLSLIIITGCFDASENISFPIYQDMEALNVEGKIEANQASNGEFYFSLNIPGRPVITLQSNVIDLKEYDKQNVKVTGYYKDSESKSKTFWVQRVGETIAKKNTNPTNFQKDIELEEGLKLEIVTTDNYSFSYPDSLVLSKESGTIYFGKKILENEEEQTKNVLEFSIDTQLPPNFIPDVQYQNLKGKRMAGKTILYSDITKRVYTFTYSNDDHPTAELDIILSSFVEKNKPEEPEPEEEISVPTDEEKTEKTKALEPSEYKNLITDNSWDYESSYAGVKMKIPKGYWYKNFGGQPNGAIVYLAVAKNEINETTDAQTFVSLFKGEKPSQDTQTAEKIQLYFDADPGRYFLIEGPSSAKNLIMSIGSTLQAE